MHLLQAVVLLCIKELFSWSENILGIIPISTYRAPVFYTRPLSEINSQRVLSFSRFDPVPFYSSGDYKSQDAQLPCGPLGNKEPSLRGRGAVHRLSDAKPWKSGLS